jgi:hypothetical protein
MQYALAALDVLGALEDLFQSDPGHLVQLSVNQGLHFSPHFPE